MVLGELKGLKARPWWWIECCLWVCCASDGCKRRYSLASMEVDESVADAEGDSNMLRCSNLTAGCGSLGLKC